MRYREIKKSKFTQLESSTVGIQLWLFDPVFYQTCSFCLVRFGLYMTLRKTFWSHHSTYPRLYITTLQTLQNQCETLHQVLIWNHTLKTKLHRNHYHISTHQKCHFNDTHMKQGKTLHFWKGEFKIGREKKTKRHSSDWQITFGKNIFKKKQNKAILFRYILIHVNTVKFYILLYLFIYLVGVSTQGFSA